MRFFNSLVLNVSHAVGISPKDSYPRQSPSFYTAAARSTTPSAAFAPGGGVTLQQQHQMDLVW